jgi:hypothetical protein
MKTKDKARLTWAIDYLNYCIHENCADIDDLEGMTDDEIIAKADAYEEKGEMAYDAWKEDGGIRH